MTDRSKLDDFLARLGDEIGERDATSEERERFKSTRKPRQ